jgi:hypothetical protein
MGFPEDSLLENSAAINPVDDRFLKFLWRKFGRHLDLDVSESGISALKSVYDVQLLF